MSKPSKPWCANASTASCATPPPCSGWPASRTAIITPNLTVYSMSKSALLAFTRGLARELGPRNITVNLIQPGPIDTDQNPADGDWAEANTRLTALGRYGNPSDIAAAVTFLASTAAQFMTGSVVTVDAGFNA